jgi:hypothetical protein
VNTYCVILRLKPVVGSRRYPLNKRFYLKAAAADEAIHTASDDNPLWRVVGIEPSDLLARLLRGDHPRSTSSNWHAS